MGILVLSVTLSWAVGLMQPVSRSRHEARGARVDLALHPHPKRVSPGIDVTPPEPTPEPKGAYLGPIFLDGVYAKSVEKVPAQLRKGMGNPVGPEPMVFDKGGGAGLYARF